MLPLVVLDLIIIITNLHGSVMLQFQILNIRTIKLKIILFIAPPQYPYTMFENFSQNQPFCSSSIVSDILDKTIKK